MSVFRRQGCAVWDADDCVHALLASDRTVCEAILKAFGPSVMLPGGGVDRNALGAQVFQDAESRKMLEQLLHGHVRAVLDDWLHATVPDNGANVRVAAIPLLFEAGWDRVWAWDAVVCVTCPEPVQLARLKQQRGWDPQQTRQRMDAQWPQSRKAALSDYVIENSGRPQALRSCAEDVLRRIMENA